MHMTRCPQRWCNQPTPLISCKKQKEWRLNEHKPARSSRCSFLAVDVEENPFPHTHYFELFAPHAVRHGPHDAPPDPPCCCHAPAVIPSSLTLVPWDHPTGLIHQVSTRTTTPTTSRVSGVSFGDGLPLCFVYVVATGLG